MMLMNNKDHEDEEYLMIWMITNRYNDEKLCLPTSPCIRYPLFIIKRVPVLDLNYLGAILPLSDHPIGCFTLGLNTLVNGTVAAAAVGSATMLLSKSPT